MSNNGRPRWNAGAATAAADLGAVIERLRHDLVERVVAQARAGLDHAFAAKRNGRGRAQGAPVLPSAAIPFAIDPASLQTVLARVVDERRLSPREAQAVAALAHGVPRKRLALVLGVGENTVKTFVHAALKKLHKRNADDAIWWLRGEAQRLARSSTRRR